VIIHRLSIDAFSLLMIGNILVNIAGKIDGPCEWVFLSKIGFGFEFAGLALATRWLL
jgi:hypothetical protein